MARRPRKRRRNRAPDAADLLDYTARTSNACEDRILETIAEHGEGNHFTVAELAGLAGCSESTARRALRKLEGGYQPLVKSSRMGDRQRRSLGLKPGAMTYEPTRAGVEALEARQAALVGKEVEAWEDHLDTSFDPSSFGGELEQGDLVSTVEDHPTDEGRVIAIHDPDTGATLGQAHVAPLSDPHYPNLVAWEVRGVRVDPSRRRDGIGTWLYELAAAEAEREGVPLASSSDRTWRQSRFWGKQKKKGRTRTVRGTKGGGSRYVLDFPPPPSLNPRAEKVATRTTADGQKVVMWSDGTITGRMGYHFPGVPAGRARTDEGRERALAAGWLMLGDVELYDAAEIPALYKAAKRVSKRGGRPGDLRAEMAKGDKRGGLSPVWEVLRADRDGRPTERVWLLPRIRWPGLAVWDHVSHGRGGRYEIVSVRDGVAETTGRRFRTLSALSDALHDWPKPNPYPFPKARAKFRKRMGPQLGDLRYAVWLEGMAGPCAAAELERLGIELPDDDDDDDDEPQKPIKKPAPKKKAAKAKRKATRKKEAPPPAPAPTPAPAAGLTVATLSEARAYAGDRPFRAPHHTAHTASLLDELEMARGGVLYLDSLADFSRSAVGLIADSLTGSGVELIVHPRPERDPYAARRWDDHAATLTAAVATAAPAYGPIHDPAHMAPAEPIEPELTDYDRRRLAKAERLRERAAAKRAQARAAHQQSRDIVGRIPMGQPILVGHHSERRHRRDLERSDRAMRRAIDADDYAASLEARAARAEALDSGPISADDPRAIDKLREKLAGIEATRASIKEANKLIRKAAKALGVNYKTVRDSDTAASVLEHAKTLGLSDVRAAEAASNWRVWRGVHGVGIPAYTSSNLANQARQVKQRIAQLEREAAKQPHATRDDAELDLGNGWSIEQDAADNRIRVHTPGRPSPEVKAELKRAALRWSRRNTAWQRQLTDNARRAVARLIDALVDLGELEEGARVVAQHLTQASFRSNPSDGPRSKLCRQGKHKWHADGWCTRKGCAATQTGDLFGIRLDDPDDLGPRGGQFDLFAADRARDPWRRNPWDPRAMTDAELVASYRAELARYQRTGSDQAAERLHALLEEGWARGYDVHEASAWGL